MWWLLFFIFPLYAEFCQTYTYPVSSRENAQTEIIWEKLSVAPFQELVLSWHASRPSKGRYTFFISVRQNNEWSPWLYYAEWSCPGQIMFRDRPEPSLAAAHAGFIKPTKGTCDAFRIWVTTSGGADLQNFYNFSVCATNPSEFSPSDQIPDLSPIFIESVPRHSQITARHPRYLDLSLPTAMTILINQCLGAKTIQPGDFAERVADDDTAFYEDSSLNIAEASDQLKGQTLFELSYLPDFASLHERLSQGHPVIVFISGWFQGCPRPYRTEHAICMIGYDPTARKVHALDPAFPNDKATLTSYDLSEFLKGWAKQRNKAIFVKRVSAID